MSDARHERPSIATANHMRAIADLWPDLETRLGKQGTTDGTTGRTRPASKPPIDTHVADVMAKIQDWAAFLGRTLLSETEWKPPTDITTPNLLRDIAKWRIGHFTEHEDEMLAQAIIDDAEEMHALALRTARPSGVRRVPLHVRCMEHDTNDQGERIECAGEYYALLLPWRSDVPDMVCSEDETHRMSPWQWQRAQKKTNRSGLAKLRVALDIASGT